MKLWYEENENNNNRDCDIKKNELLFYNIQLKILIILAGIFIIITMKCIHLSSITIIKQHKFYLLF